MSTAPATIRISEPPRSDDGGARLTLRTDPPWTTAGVLPEYSQLLASNVAVGLAAGRLSDEPAVHVGKKTSAPDVREGVLGRIIRPVKLKELPTRSRLGTFQALQRWEGVVLDVGSDVFKATVIDLTATMSDKEAEIPLEEISPSDRDLVVEGAVFYWSIGYLDGPSGQRTRESIIRFRRLPAWSSQELEDAQQRADKLLERLSEPNQ